MQRIPLSRFLTACGLLLFSADLLVAVEFMPLGFPTTDSSGHLNVSEDGSVVVGGGREPAYRWTRETGAQPLLGLEYSALSGDGSTIAGVRKASGDAVRISDGVVDVLPMPVGYDTVFTRNISQDGSTVIGNVQYDWIGEDGLIREKALVRWVDAAAPEILEEWVHEIRGRSYTARGVSANGDVVVGSTHVAFRWTEETGTEELPSLNPEYYMGAFGVSSDGRWTVGASHGPNSSTTKDIPVRWDGVSPPEPLTFDDRWKGCAPRDVNADGSRIVGQCFATNSGPLFAAVWTQETGFVSLQDLLVNEYGLGEEIEGWSFRFVSDITDDGRFLVGRGSNPKGLTDEAFLVDLSPNLPGDFNADGQLDGLDIDELSAVVREGSHPKQFDLTDDDLVNEDDRTVWVHELKRTYFGDANLDLEFNSSDMTQVFAAGMYETGEAAGWGDGDWSGDGFFTSSDMVTAFVDGGYEKGPMAEAAAVPEPGGWLLLSLSVAGLLTVRRRC